MTAHDFDIIDLYTGEILIARTVEGLLQKLERVADDFDVIKAGDWAEKAVLGSRLRVSSRVLVFITTGLTTNASL